MSRLILALPVLLALAACNQTAPPSQPASSNSFVTSPSFKLPAGSGCGGDISRFRAIIDNDLETGNVGEGVHKSMVAELRQPESLCAAGNEAGARSALAAVKTRHGYH